MQKIKYLRIKSIKKIGKRKTFDISVDKTHNFILANNIISHNSETRGVVAGQDDYTLVFRTTSFRDKEELCLDSDTKIIIPLTDDIEAHNWMDIKLKDLPENFNVLSLNQKTNIFEIKKAKKTKGRFRICYETIFPDGEKVISSKEHRFAYYNKNKTKFATISRLWEMFKLKHKKIGERWCYDLMVEDNHNFVLSNLIISHNCQSWKQERRITTMQMSDMAFLNKGECFVVETARNARKVQLVLPRTMFWKREYGNFYRNIWERYGGEWMYTDEKIDYINNKCRKKTATDVINELIKKNDDPASPTSQVIEEPKREVIDHNLKDSVKDNSSLLEVQPGNKDALMEELEIQNKLQEKKKPLKPKKPIIHSVYDWGDAL